MSFHGGLLGVLVGGWLYCRRKKMNFLENADVYVVTIPIGLGLGRVGNFINGELFGRASDVPWAMVFPGGGPVARHPSQLYEFLLEGVVLFIILNLFIRKPRPTSRPLRRGSGNDRPLAGERQEPDDLPRDDRARHHLRDGAFPATRSGDPLLSRRSW